MFSSFWNNKWKMSKNWLFCWHSSISSFFHFILSSSLWFFRFYLYSRVLISVIGKRNHVDTVFEFAMILFGWLSFLYAARHRDSWSEQWVWRISWTDDSFCLVKHIWDGCILYILQWNESRMNWLFLVFLSVVHIQSL